MSSGVRRQRRELTLGVTIILVLALGLAVSATGYFLTRNRGLADPPDAKPAPEHSALALVEPPGAPGPSGPFTLAALRNTVSLPQTVVDTLTTAGMSDGVRRTATRGEVTIKLYALVTADPRAAVAAYDRGLELQGLAADRNLSLVGVSAHRTPVGASPARFGTAYVLYDRVIVVETTSRAADAAHDVFRATLDRQIDLAPPTDRS